MAETETKKGSLKVASIYQERASESEQHSERLKEFLLPDLSNLMPKVKRLLAE